MFSRLTNTNTIDVVEQEPDGSKVTTTIPVVIYKTVAYPECDFSLKLAQPINPNALNPTSWQVEVTLSGSASDIYGLNLSAYTGTSATFNLAENTTTVAVPGSKTWATESIYTAFTNYLENSIQQSILQKGEEVVSTTTIQSFAQIPNGPRDYTLAQLLPYFEQIPSEFPSPMSPIQDGSYNPYTNATTLLQDLDNVVVDNGTNNEQTALQTLMAFIQTLRAPWSVIAMVGEDGVYNQQVGSDGGLIGINVLPYDQSSHFVFLLNEFNNLLFQMYQSVLHNGPFVDNVGTATNRPAVVINLPASAWATLKTQYPASATSFFQYWVNKAGMMWSSANVVRANNNLNLPFVGCYTSWAFTHPINAYYSENPNPALVMVALNGAMIQSINADGQATPYTNTKATIGFNVAPHFQTAIFNGNIQHQAPSILSFEGFVLPTTYVGLPLYLNLQPLNLNFSENVSSNGMSLTFTTTSNNG